MNHADTLKELVQISRDGLTFYQDAMKDVSDPQLQALFARMAQHKREIIESLSQRLRLVNEDVPTSGTIAGKLRQAYADVRVALSRDEDKTWVAQLEETEDRLLEQFSSAIERCEDPSVRSILQAHIPQVRACHDAMRDTKRRLAA